MVKRVMLVGLALAGWCGVCLVAPAAMGADDQPPTDQFGRPVQGTRTQGDVYYKEQPGGPTGTFTRSSDGQLVKVGTQPTTAAAPLAATVGAAAALAPANSGLFSSYTAIRTGSWPEVVAIGDVNNDGRNDVVLATSFYFDSENDFRIHVFLQDLAGRPAFAYKLSAGGDPTSLAVGDVNSDGRNDVVVGHMDDSIGVFLQGPEGRLQDVVAYSTDGGRSDGVAIADVNGDGRNDIAVSFWGGPRIAIFHQNAQGTFDPPVSYASQNGGYDEITAGDVNHDGDADVLLMSGQGLAPSLSVYLQDRTRGVLDSPATYDLIRRNLTHAVGIGDVNSDGRQDVVVTFGGNRPSSKLGVFLQNANGALDAPLIFDAYDIPDAVEVADVNLDGRADVVVAHGGWTKLSVYLQQLPGAASLLAPYELYPIPYASSYQPQGLAVGDFNTDGSPDVAIADYNNGLVLLMNAHENTVYVDRAARGGGVPLDGSQLYPYRSLATALNVAFSRRNGAIIKAAVGTYTDVARIRQGMRVYGGYPSSSTPDADRWTKPRSALTTLKYLDQSVQLIVEEDVILNRVLLRGNVKSD